MNRSITNSSQVGREIVINVLVRRELIQVCFEQVNIINVNYWMSRTYLDK